MKKTNTRLLAIMALLVALHIVLSRFLSINTFDLKIGFAFIPIFVAAYLYGPMAAGIVGALGDFLGAILFPIGAYFPGFTLTAFCTGLTFGLLLHRKQTMVRIAAATAVNQLILGLLVNTFWQSILYGTPFLARMYLRIPQCLILIPVEFVVMAALSRALFPRLKGVITT